MISTSEDMDAYVTGSTLAINSEGSRPCLIENLSGNGWDKIYYHLNFSGKPAEVIHNVPILNIKLT